MPDDTPLSPVSPSGTATSRTPELVRLVYTSQAVALLGPVELARVLAASRSANHQAGITGLLLYHQGRFVQCLEGPGGMVDALYARIRGDARHHGVTTLAYQPIARPLFAAWDMAFTTIGPSTWFLLSSTEWRSADDGTPTPGISQGFALLERIWHFYRGTTVADAGPPGY